MCLYVYIYEYIYIYIYVYTYTYIYACVCKCKRWGLISLKVRGLIMGRDVGQGGLKKVQVVSLRPVIPAAITRVRTVVGACAG